MTVKIRPGETLRICGAATSGPWTDKALPGDKTGDPNSLTYGMSPSVPVAATAPGIDNRIYANPPGGTYPAADGRFIVHAREALPEYAEFVRDVKPVLERMLTYSSSEPLPVQEIYFAEIRELLGRVE